MLGQTILWDEVNSRRPPTREVWTGFRTSEIYYDMEGLRIASIEVVRQIYSASRPRLFSLTLSEGLCLLSGRLCHL